MHGVPSEMPSSPLELRHASTEHALIVVVPERRLLVIEGIGRSGAADFRLAAGVLRAVHDAVRASLRRDRFADGPRPVTEIAWPIGEYANLGELGRAIAAGDVVRWRQMIELPRLATVESAEAAILQTRLDGGRDVPLVRIVATTEGRAAQILQLAGMAGLLPAVTRLESFIAEAGFRPRGGLHQLVFGDPDVVPAERVRSILRAPVA
jgi:hypothetical protein